MYLLPEAIIDSVTHLKKDILNGKMVSLDVDETENLKLLRGCEVHITHILTPGDEA